jgi:hypothetical protein
MVINKKQIAPGIIVYSNAIENHESLVSDIEDGASSAKIEWIEAKVKTDGDSYVNKESRDTLVIPVRYSNIEITNFNTFHDAFNATLSNLFLKFLAPLEDDYKRDHALATTWHDQYSILKYGIGQKFTNHIDDHKDFHRRMSTIYYLNDNYEGGEIVFPRFNVIYKPKANDFIAFPSNYMYNHSVSPVISGQRYAVVSWLT